MSAATRRPDVAIVDRHGELRRHALEADQQIALWARVLHRDAHGVVEVVAGRREADNALTMRARNDPARFPAAGDIAALVALVARHRDGGEEVFATPLARREARSGKAGGVLDARCCWVDIDDRQGLQRLRAFARRPHLVVYSGSGGAHAYWRLAEALDGEALEAANRILAHHLGGDPACTDRARIMRIAGTHNHKADRPCRLAYVDLASAPVAPGRLVAGLADPDPPTPLPSAAQRARQAAWLRADDAAQLDPPAYFAALTGRQVSERGSHVPCPLPDHREQMSSCMVYPSTAQGWWCFGCSRGGAIYDLASLLDGGPWGHDLRGEQFTTVKRAVQDRLGLRPQPQRRRRGRGGDQGHRAAAEARP
ncbi:MAG: RepB family DNA primase [Solirubrobacteraceae bacterium MAG38_C4-C5]|nr:RepB family DNA primase [Candidatus Siliceabacter maunaloa]